MSQPSWQLYGTLGCHLCEQAEQLLQQFMDTRAVQLVLVDIADLPESDMNSLALHIPVLRTPQEQLNWPFSLADLMRAYQRGTSHD